MTQYGVCGVACGRANGLLYMLELLADNAGTTPHKSVEATCDMGLQSPPGAASVRGRPSASGGREAE